MAVKMEEMVVRAGADAPAAEGAPQISAMTADELGAKLEGPQVAVSADVQAAANAVIESYKTRASAMVARQMAKLAKASEEAPAELGEPTHLGYVYWDLLSISPIQFIGLPPYAPGKIIASGEPALFLAVLFINPATNVFNPLAGTTVLGGRGFRVRFEEIDLTNVTNLPAFTFTGVFPPTAPVISFFPVFIIAPDPGVNPRLVEQNVTADITDIAQPFAAFATNVLDVDSDPAFPPVPPTGPGFEHDIPLRYLIYRK